jgi:primosomal protein N' (replication factor Y) (superfamily II helicase)
VIARVQPLTRTRAVRGTFDYLLSAEQAPVVGVGSVLRIRFGGQRPLGVVTALSETTEVDPGKLSEPDEVLESALTPELVGLAEWMAHEYCSTTARALSLMLSPGAAQGTGPKRVLVAELTGAGRDVLAPEPGADPAPRLSSRQRELLTTLQRTGPAAASELGTDSLKRLSARGLVVLDRRTRPRRPPAHAVGAASATAPPLMPAQQAALARLLEAIRTGPGAAPATDGAAPVADRPDPGQPEFLLHGVTGSGKTEVYLGAVEAVLNAGRTAIVLVPEIAMTPQTLSRFQARFGDVVAVLHSALTKGQRRDEWFRLRSGEARVCVGPRSAVLAPLSDIGLIVVDEEHEGSYKHEGDPRFDARAVARRRAQAHGATLVLGSATPRPESVYELTPLRLPERVDGRPMPPVELLDMRSSHQPLHPETRMALADLRHAGGKAIMLLNRRGWSNFLSCRNCGRVWLCPNCAVALVLHRHGSFVACHHCGHREPVPDRCPDCASVSVARHGAGTERIEHELREGLGTDAFPIFRLDADASTLQARARTLQAFEAARAGVLVGTQMVAKGHDFPDVSLGVVIDADQTLRFPDFRSEERTFALVTQLAGRTGRGVAAGTGTGIRTRVLVQTLAPDARSLRFAARHDADGFVADELSRRRALRYPPFASLIRVVCSAESEPDAGDAAMRIHELVVVDGATVLGPAPLFRLRGRFRSQVFVKATDREPAIEAVGRAVDAVAPAAARRGVAVSVDVDPV